MLLLYDTQLNICFLESLAIQNKAYVCVKNQKLISEKEIEMCYFSEYSKKAKGMIYQYLVGTQRHSH